MTLEDTPCVVESVNETVVICRTGAHRPSIITKAKVSIGSDGLALQVIGLAFIFFSLYARNFVSGYL